MENEGVTKVLQERRQTHGAFIYHACLTQALKRAMRESKNWDTLPDDMKEALEMIQHKIGRILSGDPAYQDHWVDIEGYARLVSQRLGPDLSQQPPSPLPPQR